MLGWSQERLATASGLSGPTVKRFETEGARVSDEAVAKMRSALEAAGVIFLDEGEMRDGGPGVRLRR
ncbi:helix-turn-helix domain-containing protein [Methylocella sp.]|uniref:helix-turn-helix domain-containing protein n=1 Tax=Methylocella sp. TaxID=1978226 RepID=UPI0035AE7305